MKLINVFLSVVLVSQLLTSPLLAKENSQQALPKLGLQLWSVRAPLQQNFEGTLIKLVELGFEGIELHKEFGPYVNDPKGLKTFLDSIGLQVISAHVPLRNLTDKVFNKTIQFYKDAGVNIIIVPNDGRSDKPDRIDSYIADLNKMQIKLRKLGMRLGVHNHAKELSAYKNTTFWDHIAKNTPNDLILQLDIGHAEYAGVSPEEYIRRYPNRTVVPHVKARIPKGVKGKVALIGQDVTDWHNVLKATVTVGGTKWWVLEQDNTVNGLSPIEMMAQSKLGLETFIQKL